MSRSNPNENGLPNPSTRWFEWNSETGVVFYYDKDAKQKVDVGSDFTFILLDQLGCVRGWHEASKSGIYSNEVKDTRQEVLVVKSFKGGPIAQGIYKDIKDRVNTEGGRFNANCYIGFKNGSDTLKLGSIRFKGAALGAWMEFAKQHRAELYKQAVRIKGAVEGKKGRVTFLMPAFTIVPLSEDTNKQATELDKGLQEFLALYLKRTKAEQVDHVASAHHVSDEEIAADEDRFGPPITEDDIPF